MKNQFLLIFRLAFIVLLSLTFSNCEKDEVDAIEETQTQQLNKVQVNTNTKVSKKAINFIKARTNNSLAVDNKKGRITLSEAAISSKNAALGIVDTSKEIVVINETNVKHTFKVIDNDNDNKTFTNLIVVETENSTYEYFVKYTLYEGVSIRDTEGNLDFSQFRGRIETFNSEGDIIGDILVEDGSITSQSGQLSPCPDEPIDDTSTNTNDAPTDGNSTSSSSTSAGVPGSDTNSSNTTNDNTTSGGWFASSDNDDCGLSWSYAQCDCGGDANGHSPQAGYACCQGSPLTITDCYGNVIAEGRDANTTTMFKRNPTDPCNDGDVGVILDEEELCAMDDESFNAYYSERSPFKVDMSEIRKRCDTILPPNPVNERFMCIYNKLVKSTTFQNLFTNVFGVSNNNLDVKFKIVDNMSVNGRCKIIEGQVDSNGNLLNIKMEILIDRDYLNTGARISVAKTIVHECIHAYLNIKKLDCNQGTTFDEINNKLFSELINEYYDGSCETQQEGHEFMFDYMIPSMQTILGNVRDNFIPENHQNFAESHNFASESNPIVPSSPWNWNDFYYNLSLQGLENTQKYQQQIGSDPIKRFFYLQYREIGNQFSKTHCQD